MKSDFRDKNAAKETKRIKWMGKRRGLKREIMREEREGRNWKKRKFVFIQKVENDEYI